MADKEGKIKGRKPAGFWLLFLCKIVDDIVKTGKLFIGPGVICVFALGQTCYDERIN